MTERGRLPRHAAAKAAAVSAGARARQARAARSAAEKARRRAERKKLGKLRDRVVRPSTIRRYEKHCKEFFTWLRHTGREVPRTVQEFDGSLCLWAGHLLGEGDSKSLFSNALSGLAHFVDALRGRLDGSWRLFKAWKRCEKARQAPPLGKLAAQAMAGWFQKRGPPGAATVIL